MKPKFKILPAVMTILSVLYLIYVVSSESTTLVADAVGGDPGGKVLPMIIAIFLIAGFLFITLKERPNGQNMDKETLVLFLLTLGLAILYVLVIKYVGFIILSTLMLYTLEYVYTTIGEKRKATSAIVGGLVTTAGTVGIYTLMRLLAKTLTRLGKRGAIPAVFGKGTAVAVVCMVFVAIMTVLLCILVLKPLKKRGLGRVASAGVITFSTVLILYVVFKQFFLVALAQGLLKF